MPQMPDCTLSSHIFLVISTFSGLFKYFTILFYARCVLCVVQIIKSDRISCVRLIQYNRAECVRNEFEWSGVAGRRRRVTPSIPFNVYALEWG